MAEQARVAAVFPATTTVLGAAELEAAANRAAHAFRSLGLRRGDCIAFSVGNRPQFLELMLGAQRNGLYYVLLSTKLSVDDARYILADSGATVALFDATSFAAADEAALHAIHPRIFGIGLGNRFPDWDALAASMPETLPAEPSPGAVMLYSSGTTGRPKGVRKRLAEAAWNAPDPANIAIQRGLALGADSVFYCPCPLYHAAPHRFLSAALAAGAKVVIPERFDAATALADIEHYQVTHSLWVPTMFHRLLRLPEAERRAHDLGSHQHAVHGAAPCPIHVKRAMIDWWGPILDEYYSGSEGIGSSMIGSAEWLQHPGSVGRPSGCKVHILGEHGEELPPGETGDIYFESDMPFSYWNDAEKTRNATSARGWRTFGDVGHVDEDGYLYLTDRRHFTIISGGVNIYPQEIESVLLEDERVRDAAVIGIPDEDFGQIALAVVEAADGVDRAGLAEALLAMARSRLGPVKAPKRLELMEKLPRHDTGKLYKGELIARFSA